MAGARDGRGDAPGAIGKEDLRVVARGSVPHAPLAEVLERAQTADDAERLWLADRWPWTPGSDAALCVRRPRWAVAVVELSLARGLEGSTWDLKIRELNRALDPWPPAARAMTPPPRTEAPALAEDRGPTDERA